MTDAAGAEREGEPEPGTVPGAAGDEPVAAPASADATGAPQSRDASGAGADDGDAPADGGTHPVAGPDADSEPEADGETEADGEPGAGGEPDARAAFREQFAQAAERSGLGALAREQQLDGRELLRAIGGVRGILEALVPGLVFLVVYTVLTSFAGRTAGEALVPSLGASVGLAVVFTLVRLVGRSQPTQAIGGLLGVVASAALALWTGDARDNYVLGFWTNGAYVLGLTVSLLVKWPLIGLVVGALMGDVTGWRKVPRQYRLGQALTLLWVGLFAARLIVQVPLYLADNVQALGAMRLLMGVPLYALVLVFTWLVVRGAWSSERRSAR